MTERYPWHDDILADLRKRSQRGVLPAAIGLSCAEGWGGRALLIRAAMQLLDLTRDITPEEFAHPDFRWIVPDGAIIKIDQIRALNAFAAQTPQIAKRKVAAVFDAHLLNINAANTLLKTLEEPPPNTHVLLCTPYWSRLLPTIRSRCQRLQVRTNDQQAQQWLTDQGLSFSMESFALAGHAPLTLHEQVTQIDVQGFVTRVAAARAFGSLVDEAVESGPTTLLAGWYRLLIQQQRGRPSRLLLAFADELNESRRMIETSNSTNIRLTLERLFYLWQQIDKPRGRQQPTV